MCIAFISLRQHERYPLVVAANRDEYNGRPTEPLHSWEEQDVVAGKDLQAGGSWLSVNSKGRLSLLTHFRSPKETIPSARSRGLLVIDALCTDKDSEKFVTEQKAYSYNPHNLIFGDSDHLFYFHSPEQKLEELESGIHGISNGKLNEAWPKVMNGSQHFEQILATEYDSTALKGPLFQLLQDQEKAEDHDLPQTGLDQEVERFLSSIFICSERYGTRCSTVLFVDRQGRIEISEKTYDAQGQQTGQKTLSL